jgi:hypothetical protein
MPGLQVKRLFDYSELPEGWVVYDRSVGAGGEICLLLSTEREDDSSAQTGTSGAPVDDRRYRLLVVSDSAGVQTRRTVDLDPAIEFPHQITPFGGGRWLLCVRLWRERRVVVLGPTGSIIHELAIELPLELSATSGGDVWIAVGGHLSEVLVDGLEHYPPDLIRISSSGEETFRLSTHRSVEAILPIWWMHALNAIDANEVWFSYSRLESNRTGEQSTWLVHLLDSALVDYLPASVVESKAPVSLGRPFALWGGWFLLRGGRQSDDGSPKERLSPDRDQDRLYLVSRESSRSVEFLPVDDSGQWIGEFRTFQARGSTLYLSTDKALFAADVRTALSAAGELL